MKRNEATDSSGRGWFGLFFLFFRIRGPFDVTFFVSRVVKLQMGLLSLGF